MAPFTSTAWTVSSGDIVTSSTTPLTIPVFPIDSAALLSLSLTVGIGLAILPGAPIMIADLATGLNYMYGYVISYVASTGALVVQIGMSFLFEIRRGCDGDRGYNGSGYAPYYDFGSYDRGPLLQATNGNGVAITDIGFIQILIPASIFQKLSGGTYTAALVMTDSVSTREILIGQLPVIHGGVSRMPLPANTGYNPNIF